MIGNKQVLTFVDKVLELLKPMGKIDISEAGKNKYLSKDKITFAKIINDQILLRANSIDGYITIAEEIIKDHDQFLTKATNAYCLAKAEKGKLSQSN